MAKHRLFTSESVTEGHPDKICDQISDAILDEILTHDPEARVACETCASTGMVHIMGEITTNCYVDFQKIVREVVADIGYTRAKFGFDADTCAVISNVDGQSPDIALGTNDEVGRCRRPGHDVRLCLRRDPGADAHAHLPGPQAGQAADRGAQERRAGLPAPGRQEPGHRGVRRTASPPAWTPWSSPPSTREAVPMEQLRAGYDGAGHPAH